MDDGKDSVPASEHNIRPLLIGASVSKLVLRDVDGNSFDLNAAISAKPTILVFYRGGW